jgi:Relaxase/Mobilisation nuclease domain/Protein of unknown function (DUF3945)
MMVKSIRGSGFAGSINYAYDGELEKRKAEDKKAEILLYSDNLRVPRDASDLKGRNRMISDFVRQAGGNNRLIKEPVGQHIISFNPEDTLNAEKKMAILTDYIKERGLLNTQYVAIEHHDTKHEHIHVYFNRIDNSGKTLDSNNYIENTVIGYDLSQKYRLKCPPQIKTYIQQLEKKDPNFRENIGNRASEKTKKRAETSEVKNMQQFHPVLERARNMFHLKKLCEEDQLAFELDEIEKKAILAGNAYKIEDLNAVFLLNRQEAKQKSLGAETPKIRSSQPDYMVKLDRISTANNPKPVVDEIRKAQNKDAIMGVKLTDAQKIDFANGKAIFLRGLAKRDTPDDKFNAFVSLAEAGKLKFRVINLDKAINGVKLTDEQKNVLLDGHSVYVQGLKTSEGKEYNADIKLSSDKGIAFTNIKEKLKSNLVKNAAENLNKKEAEIKKPSQGIKR